MKWNHKWKLWTKHKSHLDNRMATVSSSVRFSFFPLSPALTQAQAGWTGMAPQRLTTKTPRKDCPFGQNIEKNWLSEPPESVKKNLFFSPGLQTCNRTRPEGNRPWRKEPQKESPVLGRSCRSEIRVLSICPHGPACRQDQFHRRGWLTGEKTWRLFLDIGPRRGVPGSQRVWPLIPRRKQQDWRLCPKLPESGTQPRGAFRECCQGSCPCLRQLYRMLGDCGANPNSISRLGNKADTKEPGTT